MFVFLSCFRVFPNIEKSPSNAAIAEVIWNKRAVRALRDGVCQSCLHAVGRQFLNESLIAFFKYLVKLLNMYVVLEPAKCCVISSWASSDVEQEGALVGGKQSGTRVSDLPRSGRAHFAELNLGSRLGHHGSQAAWRNSRLRPGLGTAGSVLSWGGRSEGDVTAWRWTNSVRNMVLWGCALSTELCSHLSFL